MAFLNVTGCHAHDPGRLFEGNVYTLETMRPDVLIPTHAIDREYVYAEAADALVAEGVTTSVCCPMNRGDSYFWNGQAMELSVGVIRPPARARGPDRRDPAGDADTQTRDSGARGSPPGPYVVPGQSHPVNVV